jgi:signal transduction histidine kinase
LLGHLRRGLSHDVSNHLVAVQGLLQLLNMEESGRLSPEGQDYVRRASAATQRAQGLISTLKELARLGWEQVPPREVLSLDGLVRELGAELKALHPASVLECRLAHDAVRVAAPGRLLHQALLRLLRSLLAGSEEAPRRVGLRSRLTPSGVELTVAEVAPEPRPGSGLLGRDTVREGSLWPGDRHDWALVQELVAACGGIVAARAEPGRGGHFTLVIPAP